MRKRCLVWVWSWMCVLLVVQAYNQFDTLNILLPEVQPGASAFPVQIITALGGCYTWSSSAPNIATVETYLSENSLCSQKALVRLIHIGEFRSSLFITAVDSQSEEVANIPLRVKRIDRISIFSKSRLMNVRETQELKIIGFDIENNVFTSLEGLKFTWTLEQQEQSVGKMLIKSAQLLLPMKIREDIEAKGGESDLIVIKAIQPGYAVVRATCVENGYERVKDSILISVNQRFSLQPSGKIYLLPHSQFQFTLRRLSGELISVPKSYYQYSVGDSFKATPNLLLSTPDKKDETVLKVQDTRTKPAYGSQTEVFVEIPDDLQLKASEYLTVGESQPIQINLFSMGRLLLGSTSDLVIKSDVELDQKNMMINCKQKKAGKITVTYRNLKAQQKINCLLPLTIVFPSSRLIFPEEQHFQLLVLGGSGQYKYSLSDNSVASVTESGLLHTLKEGVGEISVVDKMNVLNKAHIKLIVERPHHVESLERRKELNINEAGQLYAIGRTKSGEQYSRCDQSALALSVYHFQTSRVTLREAIPKLETLSYSNAFLKQKLQKHALFKDSLTQVIKHYNTYVANGDISASQLRIYLQSIENYGMCDVISISSNHVFDDTVQISLKSKNHDDGATPFQLRVYEPLRNNIDRDKSEFLMTPMASLKWNTKGGSYGWDNEKKQAFLNGVKIFEAEPTVACADQNEAKEFEMVYQNPQSSELLFPVSQKAMIRFKCEFPSSLLINFEKSNIHTDSLIMPPGSQVKGIVHGVGSNGMPFYNSSNLLFESRCETGKIENSANHFTYTLGKGKDRITLSSKRVSDEPAKEYPRIKIQFTATVGDQFAIKQKNILIPFLPNKEQVLIAGLSPEIEVACKGPINCVKASDRSVIKTIETGEGYAIFKHTGIYGMPEQKIKLEVVNPNLLEIKTNRTILRLGDSATLSLSLSYDGRPIHSRFFDLSHFKLKDIHLFEIKEKSNLEYTVTAKREGRDYIRAEQVSPRSLLSQSGVQLIVIWPVEINLPSTPPTLTHTWVSHAKTTVFQKCRKSVRFTGGLPTMEIDTETNERCLKVSKISAHRYDISGSLGCQGKVVFRASFKKEQMAEFVVLVSIVRLEQIGINGNDLLLSEAQFRLNPTLLHGSKMVEGFTCDYDHIWTVSDGNILFLGEHDTAGNLFGGINATARKEGATEVHLALVDRESRRTFLKATKKITVVEGANLQFPSMIGKSADRLHTLLLPINSQLQLETDSEVEKMPCKDSNAVEAVGNRITSSEKTGTSSLKITRKFNSLPIVSHVSIEVSQISSIFIQNNGQALIFSQSEVKLIPYFLLDSYGRLFARDAKNVKLNVRLLDPSVATVTIINGNYIQFTALEEGVSLMYLELEGKPVWDSAVVRVGNIVQPQSPVYVLEGGFVQFKLKQQTQQRWSSSDSSIASVNGNGLVTASKAGVAIISINGLRLVVNVLKIHSVEDLGESTSIATGTSTVSYRYRILWMKKDKVEILKTFSSSELINNNLTPKCHCDSLFEATTRIEEDQNGNYVNCIITPQDSTEGYIPSKLDLVIKDEKTGSILHQASFPYYAKFTISKKDRNITLTKANPHHQIRIRTAEPLQLSSVNGRNQWFKTEFFESISMQVISVDMSRAQKDANWRLLVENTKNEARQFIDVRFKTEHIEPQIPSSKLYPSSSSWDWPDYLIAAMAALFAIACFLEYVKR